MPVEHNLIKRAQYWGGDEPSVWNINADPKDIDLMEKQGYKEFILLANTGDNMAVPFKNETDALSLIEKWWVSHNYPIDADAYYDSYGDLLLDYSKSSVNPTQHKTLDELRKIVGHDKPTEEECPTCKRMKDVGEPCWLCGSGDPRTTPTGIRLDKPTYGDRRHLEEINKQYKPQIENLEKKKMKVEDPWEKYSNRLIRQAIKTIKLANGPKFSDKVWAMLLAEAIKSFSQGLEERIDSDGRRAQIDTPPPFPPPPGTEPPVEDLTIKPVEAVPTVAPEVKPPPETKPQETKPTTEAPKVPKVPSINTNSGVVFNIAEPDHNAVTIEDIAHSLSNICRFAGQCDEFYSVAQHALLLSYAVPPEHALWALLHDAGEAYMGDLPRPVKKLIPSFEKVENNLLGAISKKFGLDGKMPPKIVMDFDDRMLQTEFNALMKKNRLNFGKEPLNIEIKPMSSAEAKAAFMARFAELTGAKTASVVDVVGDDVLRVIAFVAHKLAYKKLAISKKDYLRDILIAAWDKYDYDYTPQIGFEYAKDSVKKTMMNLHERISRGDESARSSAPAVIEVYEFLLNPSTERNWLQVHYASWPEYHTDPAYQDPEAEKQQQVEQEKTKPTFEQSFKELQEMAKQPPTPTPPAPKPVKPSPSRPEFAKAIEVYEAGEGMSALRNEPISAIYEAGVGDKIKNTGIKGKAGLGVIKEITPHRTVIVETQAGTQTEWDPSENPLEIDATDKARYIGHGKQTKQT